MVNGFSTLANVFSGKRRKPKTVDPDDFFNKKAKKMFRELLVQEPKQKQKEWSEHIKDARAKGLRGPWSGGEKAC